LIGKNTSYSTVTYDIAETYLTPSAILFRGEIPLHQMFADDSIWLTYYLSSLDARRDKRSHASLPKMNGWFHFAPGGDGNNQILHYFLDT